MRAVQSEGGESGDCYHSSASLCQAWLNLLRYATPWKLADQARCCKLQIAVDLRSKRQIAHLLSALISLGDCVYLAKNESSSPNRRLLENEAIPKEAGNAEHSVLLDYDIFRVERLWKDEK